MKPLLTISSEVKNSNSSFVGRAIIQPISALLITAREPAIELSFRIFELLSALALTCVEVITNIFNSTAKSFSAVENISKTSSFLKLNPLNSFSNDGLIKI